MARPEPPSLELRRSPAPERPRSRASLRVARSRSQQQRGPRRNLERAQVQTPLQAWVRSGVRSGVRSRVLSRGLSRGLLWGLSWGRERAPARMKQAPKNPVSRLAQRVWQLLMQSAGPGPGPGCEAGWTGWTGWSPASPVAVRCSSREPDCGWRGAARQTPRRALPATWSHRGRQRAPGAPPAGRSIERASPLRGRSCPAERRPGRAGRSRQASRCRPMPPGPRQRPQERQGQLTLPGRLSRS